MDAITLFMPLFLHLAIVLAPAVVAGLALQRLVASRSRNRLLYGAIALVTVVLAVRTLAEMFAGGPTDPLLVIASLASPVGWGIILWVVSTPLHVLYGHGNGGRGSEPARPGVGATPAKSPPLLLGETARVTRRVAEMKRVKDVGPLRPGGARRATVRWRPAEPLAFVPRAGRQT